jgi:tetratricopeptide (TPR) repeat protein
MAMRTLVVACLALAAGSASLHAQAPKLGRLSFPNSGSKAAQPAFIRGVLLLHSFEYEDAAAAFRDAQRADPSFALAYWGEAMTHNHPVWNEQDLDSARAILGRLAPTAEARALKARTARERAWLETVEILYGDGEKPRRDTLYSAALDRLTMSYPDDREARLFYALSLMGLSQAVRNIPAYMRAGAIAEDVFLANPEHPGAAHYIIHAFDDAQHAPLGLRAARAYSKIAPGADHAQHMTSHIFLGLGMWEETVAANEVASFGAEKDRNKWAPGHYTHWLGYGLLQQGRFEEARRHLESVKPNLGTPPRIPRKAYLLAMRAHYLVGTERWADPVTEWTLDTEGVGPGPQAMDAFALGLAAIGRGDRAAAERRLADVERLAGSPQQADRYGSNAQVPAVLAKELRGLLVLVDGKKDEALALLRAAAVTEDSLPLEYGPPDIVKPTHELLGEVLLGLGEGREAAREFERSLQLAPRRALSFLGLARAATMAGDREAAARAHAELRKIWHRADGDVPWVQEVARQW